MRKIFFDIQITGHHPEYISHLVNFIGNNQDGNHYVFVVHPEFSQRFSYVVSIAKKIENITWIEITPAELRKTEIGGLIRKSFSWFKLLNFYAKANHVQHVCLLYFNVFQLALIFFRPSYSISGIIFLQFHRMTKSSWKERLKYYRKYFITKFYSYNPRIKQVFILNDKNTVSYLNRTFKTTIFRMLPDPIPQLNPLPEFDVYQHYGIPKENHILLHIGSLGGRKGTFEFLASAKYINKDLQSKLTYLLAGRGNKDKLNQAIEKVASETDVQMILDNQFISNELMKSLFDQCDAVVIPYKNSEASSGILGHAAAAEKVVVATGKGLLDEIVKSYGLGVLIDEVAPESIAKAIVKVVLTEMKPERANVFVKERTVHHFSEELITNTY